MEVSVLMSCYNSQANVGRAIESILNQTYEDFELLICDDGSIDNTYETISEYKSLDKRIKIFKNKKNIGLTKSLNNLINEAKGVYIARQDDDDISSTVRLNTQVRALKSENLDFITSRAKVLGSERLIPGFSFYLSTSLVMNFKKPLHSWFFND